jgi:hypothetical protein
MANGGYQQINTKRFVLFMVITFGPLLAWALRTVHAEPSAMVEHHIFMPEEQAAARPEAANEKTPEVKKLERELLFTGIIIGPDGRRAMIREKPRHRGKEVENDSLLREGDEIHGMTLKHIGRNYLLLTGQGGDVRLNLFQEGKKRPPPPPEPKTAMPPVIAPGGRQQGVGGVPPVQAGRPAQPGRSQASVRTGIPGSAPQTSLPNQTITPGQGTQSPGNPQGNKPARNPFAETPKRAQQLNTGVSRRNVVNPFLEAIRRTANQQ